VSVRVIGRETEVDDDRLDDEVKDAVSSGERDTVSDIDCVRVSAYDAVSERVELAEGRNVNDRERLIDRDNVDVDDKGNETVWVCVRLAVCVSVPVLDMDRECVCEIVSDCVVSSVLVRLNEVERVRDGDVVDGRLTEADTVLDELIECDGVSD